MMRGRVPLASRQCDSTGTGKMPVAHCRAPRFANKLIETLDGSLKVPTPP